VHSVDITDMTAALLELPELLSPQLGTALSTGSLF
jgi:hypothetical protein